MSQHRTIGQRRRARSVLVGVVLALAASAAAVAALQFDPLRHAIGKAVPLRGSQPPVGRTLPDLTGIRGIDPAIPNSDANILVLSCASCQSGEVIGPFMARLQRSRLPKDRVIRVVVWGEGADTFAKRHALRETDTLIVHSALSSAAEKEIRRRTHVGDSGVVFVVGPSGRGGSTFHLGQLQLDDVLHDLRYAR